MTHLKTQIPSLFTVCVLWQINTKQYRTFQQTFSRKQRLSRFHDFATSSLIVYSSFCFEFRHSTYPLFSSHCSLISSRRLLSPFLSSENLLRLNQFSLLRKWSVIKNNPDTLIDYNSNTLSCHQCSSSAVVGKLFNLHPHKETLSFNWMSYTAIFLALMD